jgi:5-aminolevulinate synthase
MERLSHSIKQNCPFLKKTPVAGLRKLSMKSQLVASAQRCPVMSTAMAVKACQSASISSSPICPYASVVDSMTAIGDRSTSSFLNAHLSAKPKVEKDTPAVLFTNSCPFDYEDFYKKQLDVKHRDKSYRYFNNINRLAQQFPKGHTQKEDDLVTVWCSNDYLGMSKNSKVVRSMKETLDKYGAGAGGTRNIAGNSQLHLLLEQELASLHNKDAALVFSSCFVANDATISTLAGKLPGCVIFSDSSNHASMIQGIRNSRAQKMIFRHNDLDHLETLLASVDYSVPKLIAFESVYSMCGSIGPIKEIAALARKYNAITFLDEVHAVGMYGATGAGVAEYLGVLDEIDMYTGTLGKAYGVVGGYVGNCLFFKFFSCFWSLN